MENLFCVLVSPTEKIKDVFAFHTIAVDSKKAFENAREYLVEKGIEDYIDMSCTIIKSVNGHKIQFQ